MLFRSDMVPLHDALVRLAAGAGLHLERAFGYRIRRHYMKFPRQGRGGIILLDWVLVFRRQPVVAPPTPGATPAPSPGTTPAPAPAQKS